MPEKLRFTAVTRPQCDSQPSSTASKRGLARESESGVGWCAQELTGQAKELDIRLLDKKVDQMMPELGFTADDNDRLVASYSGGWQMRMCLGKILLQEPDLLLLDEPTNHLDLDALEWLEGGLL